jgi:hypothetical protein
VTFDGTPADRARKLLVFLDGVEAAALVYCGDGNEPHAALDLARRGRTVARDLIAAEHQLEAERSLRVTLQQRCDTLQAIVGDAAYQACIAGERRDRELARARATALDDEPSLEDEPGVVSDPGPDPTRPLPEESPRVG